MVDWGMSQVDRPAELGFATERLAQISVTLRADVERRLIPGAVMLVARGGAVGYAEAVGWRDREQASPMSLDAIFRIASMTKPVTSVAALMLAEQGRLQVAAPVADYLPELRDRTVGVERVRARRIMTVQDLLRHTSGLTYAAFGDTPVQMLWREAQLMREDQTNAELVAKLAALPLLFEPGTTWEYSMSTDVLGRIVEVVSGQSLAKFFGERITGPLGMVDTAFEATDGRTHRLAEPQADAATGARPPMRNVASPQRWASGGGGLVSTAADYLKFCRMLLGGGELDGVRLLSPKTIRHMTANHLPPNCAYGTTAGTGDGPRLRPRLCGAHGARHVAGAGLGRRLFLGRRHRHLLLDRPGRGSDRDLPVAGPRPPAPLPLSDAPARLRRDHRSGAALKGDKRCRSQPRHPSGRPSSMRWRCGSSSIRYSTSSCRRRRTRW
jgi:CubicO group peptidase (beta-lactamase class C family)